MAIAKGTAQTLQREQQKMTEYYKDSNNHESNMSQEKDNVHKFTLQMEFHLLKLRRPCDHVVGFGTR